jgi:hypothetical protein
LALDQSGNPVVAYAAGEPAQRLKVLRCGNPTCTSGNSVATPDADDGGWDSSLALDALGNPVVSYYSRSSLTLKLLRCGNPTCTSGNTITSPENGRGVGRATSLVLDARGQPVISYWDTSKNDLKVLRCGDPTCARGNTTSTPDADGDVGYRTSMQLDAAGFSVVAYWDTTGRRLKVLHCGSASCQ